MSFIRRNANVDIVSSNIKGKSSKDGSKKRPEKNTEDYNKTEMFVQKNDTETTESGGYGSPSKGQYSANSSGYKTFGTGGQGNSTYGTREDNSTKCKDRVMMVTVTATEDTEELAEMTMTLGNYEFVEDIGLDDIDTTKLVENEEGAGSLTFDMLKIAVLSISVITYATLW